MKPEAAAATAAELPFGESCRGGGGGGRTE